MSLRMSNRNRFVCLALILAAHPASGFEGISQIGYGAKSQSMAGTGVAADTGVGGLMNNPATLAIGTGNAFEIGLDVNVPFGTSRSTGNLGISDTVQHGPNRNPYVPPHGGYTRRLDNGLTFGIAAFSKGGAGSEYGRSSYLSIDSSGVQTKKDIGARLIGLDIPIGFSYAVNERLNIGATVDIVWTGADLLWQLNSDQLLSSVQADMLRVTNDAGFATALGGLIGAGGSIYIAANKGHIIDSEMTAFGVGGRLGLTYQLTPTTRFGAAYTTKTSLPDLEGKLIAEALNPGGAVSTTFAGDVRIEDFQWPAMLQLGVEHQFNDRFAVTLDTRYAWWADTMDAFRIRFRDKTDSAGNAFAGESVEFDVPQNWDDTLAIAVGARYRIRTAWTLRAGFSAIDNPIPATGLLPLFPTVFEKHATLGVGYAFGNSHLDFAYSYIFMDEVTNTSRPLTSTRGAPTGGTAFDMYVHKFILTYRHDF